MASLGQILLQVLESVVVKQLPHRFRIHTYDVMAWTRCGSCTAQALLTIDVIDALKSLPSICNGDTFVLNVQCGCLDLTEDATIGVCTHTHTHICNACCEHTRRTAQRHIN